MLLTGTLTACNRDDIAANVEEDTDTARVEVVRAVGDFEKGDKITSDKLEVVSVDKSSLPDATILNKDEIVGKYAIIDIMAGDYFTPVKISDKRPETDVQRPAADSDGVINFYDAGYVIVSDYVLADTGRDVSDEIQRAIDDNPNKTLYFPDGEYLISKPITTSADPTKSVSIELSNYAHFKPTENWNRENGAMFRLGATDMAEGISNSDNCYSFVGGIIDGGKIADAISIENAGTVSLRYTSIKNAVVGVYVKANEDGSGPCADVHTVNIVGSLTVDSIGIHVETNGNTLTNMRIASNQIAVKMSGSDNFLRNLHPLYIFGAFSTESYADSCAFYDEGSRNFYDNCYNDQFAVGFYMSENTASVYDCCFNYWYSTNYGIHISYYAEGQFNSTIRSSSSDTSHASEGTRCEFLVVGEKGGKGVIEAVYFNPNNVSDKAYLDYIVDEPIY